MKREFWIVSMILCLVAACTATQAQSDGLLAQLPPGGPKKELVSGAFKSSRVINNQSLEMIGKGVLDLRILHRFGLLKSGASSLYGLDQATFRLGLDYGITDNLTIGIGRSTFQKEADGLVKWRILQQSRGAGSFPLSVLWVSGITVNTTPGLAGPDKYSTSDRTGCYHELIIGRKFSDLFSLQVSPIWIHRNRIAPISEADRNDVYAVGGGMRLRITRRVSLVADYDYVAKGLDKHVYKNPLGVGFDVETGGHVFQLHFSNAQGLNENGFVTHTVNSWGKGEVNFGFNLSRVFSIRKKRI